MAQLIITLPDGREKSAELGSGSLVIGRDANCDIPVDDPGASRRHAKFSAMPGGFMIEDLGSKNGTLVNDAPCTAQALRDGDRILIGSVVVAYREGDRRSSQNVVISDERLSDPATRYVSRDRHLDLSRKRLQMIYDLSEQLTTLKGFNELLEDAMTICFEMLGFERGAIGVRHPDGPALDWPVVRNLRGAEGELTISRTLLNRALEHGERASFTDEGAGASDPTVSMVQHGIRSAMCVPLAHRSQILGVIYGDRVESSGIYSKEDVDFLGGIAQQVSIGLINCRLVNEQRKMIQLRRDIDLARTIQTGLLPASLPDRHDLKVAAVNDPGQRVSGDYYDVIEADERHVWCLVADVPGEGVAAALLTANLQATVRVTIGSTDDPAVLLSRWNRLMCDNTSSSKFITCLLALIDLQAREIRFATAGHCLPLLVRATGEPPEELAATPAYPLGVVPESDYLTTTIDAGPDPFAFVSYTDGVIEAMNGQGQTFGKEQLLEVLSDWRDLNPRGLVKHVRASVSRFAAGAAQSDDITILAALIE